MPGCPPRCTSGDKQDDCKGRVVHLLARDDQGYSRHKRQVHHLQWHRPIPTSHVPSTNPETPIYPFQHVCGDFFHHMGISYLVLVDTGPSSPHPGKEPRDSSIPSLPMGSQTQSHPTADQSSCHRSLEPSSKTETCTHRISSAYHSHANCRTEVGMKSMKRLIAGNTGPGGTLTDS